MATATRPTGIREPVQRIEVDVTFLRMDAAPEGAKPDFPKGVGVVRVPGCSVPFYRYLYDTVGRDYLWWLRRTVPDAEIAALLARPEICIHVLYQGGEPAGFYELERRGAEYGTNLAYFGLMPHAIGRGVGRALLRHAVETAWAEKPRLLTVNTCTADHPRALPNYVAAGFRVLRTVRELWPVPLRLGLPIPDRLRVG
ncbi:GNAT family N-acetyltransferase [Falsiroseomonas selenitidurans]|uniref:GNAT family N-acetyltransferase n=1 Tax=Falsiroseomonas selenitidurans TaxID=2716335 RepID=A0ABX1E8J2_9PROT|nr:GNAT family N-acetyltransferase [Falsiroseomonas selenitidurans]NKC33216.1 GNAT family N-acetyltransferase [Falsiroseomonas selenitidurans]